MATAATATISEANLSPSGGLLVPALSKKPVYTFRNVSAGQSRLGMPYRVAAAAQQPKHLLFGAISHPLLRTLKPIPVEISRKQKNYVARFKTADEFGYGETMSLALEDLGKTLAELFIGLGEKEGLLGSDLKRLHLRLSNYITYRSK
jgi:hypothetical protein